MKKIVSIVLFAGFIFGIVGCQKEELGREGHAGEQLVMKIKAGQSDTKTTLTGKTAKWKEGDKVTVMYKKNGNSYWQKAESAAASSGDEYATATFSVSLDDPNTSINAYAIYPSNNLSQSGSVAKAIIAETQHPTGTSFDGNSDIMISAPITPSESVTTTFARAGSVMKIKLNNVTLATERLLRVSVTGQNNLSGTVSINHSDHAVSGISDGSNTVSATYPNPFVIGTEGMFVYLIVYPQTLSSESTLTVSGETEHYTFSRDIVLSQDIHLGAGHIVPLNITINAINLTAKQGWYRVDYPSWLTAGDRVVIANNDGTKAMSNTQGTSNNRGEVSISVTSDKKKISTFNNNAQVFILETGSTAGSFAYWCDGGDKLNNYIYAASSSGNYLKSQASLDGNASFIASLEDGYGSLTAQGTSTNNILRYNSTNTLFSCYSSGQKDISIYKYYGTYPYGASFRFNKTSDVSALGIAIPESGNSTELNTASDYVMGVVKMNVTTASGASSRTRIYNNDGTLELRLHKSGGSITFDAGAKNITRVEFVASKFAMTTSDEGLSGKVWTGSSHSITFTASETNWISVAKITCE